MSTPLEARTATIEDLAALLKQQQRDKVDIVSPFENLTMVNGLARIAGTSVFSDGDLYRPTAIAEGHLADKLGIPIAYLRTLREQRLDLYDANVNGWIHGGHVDLSRTGSVEDPIVIGPDPRVVTIRTFVGEPGGVGVLRAVLSDRRLFIDNFDVLLALLEGIEKAGTPVPVVNCSLSETRMVVKIAAPEIFD